MKRVFIVLVFVLFGYAGDGVFDLERNKKLCRENNASACYTAAMLLYTGYKGTTKAPLESIDYYETACALGKFKACIWLGGVYMSGDYFPKDYPHAIALLEEPCRHKFQAACFAIATAYSNQKKHRQALAYYDKTCKLNNFNACNIAGTIYMTGERFGVDINYTKAIEYFEKACDPNRPKSGFGACKKNILKTARMLYKNSKRK